VSERKLKIAFVLGACASTLALTSKIVSGEPEIVFDPKQIKRAAEKACDFAGDVLQLGEISESEIVEVIKELGLEEYLVEEKK